jgi:hypothetical protein
MEQTQNTPNMAVILQQLRDEIATLQNQVQEQRDQMEAQPLQPLEPQQRVGHVINIKPERPPPFCGTKKESLEGWIFQMEQYCHLLPVPVENRIIFSATFFRDNAILWWRAYYRTIVWEGPQANIPDWNEYVTALRQQFVPVNIAVNAYDRLRRLTQRTSVNQYSHDFRSIMLDLPEMDQATRLNFYIQGLKDNICPLVAIQQPADLTTAEAMAERVDSVTFRPSNRTTGYRTPQRAPGGTVAMEIDAIGKLTDTERERLRKAGGCFRCRKTGHLARDCTLTNRQHPRISAIEEDLDQSGKE